MTATGVGEVLYVLPSIAEDDDPVVKDALGIRNAANVTGECPSCGATFGPIAADEDGVFHVVMEHENGCPVLRTVAP
jgi:hypothetical protein